MESCAGPVPGQGTVGQRRLVLQRGLDAIRLRGRADLLPGIVPAANLMASLLRLSDLQVNMRNYENWSEPQAGGVENIE